MTDVVIKVSTKKLLDTSGQVEAKIQRLEKTMGDLEKLVNSCKSYWDGESRTAYIAAYRDKADIMAQAFKRFRENVTDLQIIAGVYEETEKAAVERSQELRVDLIV